MPRKPLDLIGKRFGSLTVLYMDESVGGQGIHKIWVCRCDCGREIRRQSSGLQNGISTRCPACAQETKIKVGDAYGKWVVLGYSGTKYTDSGHHFSSWLCQCQCGKVREIPSDNLLSGRSTQCISCSRTKHGMYNTRAYKNQKYNEYREKKLLYDSEWSLEMTTALRSYFSSCVVCGISSSGHKEKYGQMFHIDHVKPLSKKNGLIPGNAVILCCSCNTRKNKKDLDQIDKQTRDVLVQAAESFRIAWESGYRSQHAKPNPESFYLTRRRSHANHLF